jgi:hypothetical protein
MLGTAAISMQHSDANTLNEMHSSTTANASETHAAQAQHASQAALTP